MQIKVLTESVADALINANQTSHLMSLLKETTPDKAYQIGTAIGGDLGLALIFYSDVLRLYNLAMMFPEASRGPTKSRFNYEANRAADVFRKLGIEINANFDEDDL